MSDSSGASALETEALERDSTHLLPPASSGRQRAVTWLRRLACLAVFLPVFSVPLFLPNPRAATCAGGQWPVFGSYDELKAHVAWARYVSAVYGSLPRHASAYPLCIGELWLLYSGGLASAGVPPAQLPATASCPRDEGRVAGQRYEAHSKLVLPNTTTWIWHPAPDGFAPFEEGAWVEVLQCADGQRTPPLPRTPPAPPRADRLSAHTPCPCGRSKGGIADEHVGAWFLTARGAGIWLHVGRRARPRPRPRSTHVHIHMCI